MKDVVKYEVALLLLSEVNQNIMMTCETLEEKKEQLAKYRHAISDLSQKCFETPFTKFKVIGRYDLSWIISLGLFKDKDYTSEYTSMER